MTGRVECKHNGKHQHGTNIMYTSADHCRCDECRIAHSAHQRHITREKAYGRYKGGHVPVAEVQAHIEKLRASGINPQRMHEITGLALNTIWRIIWETRDDSTVHGKTAKKLYAIPAGFTVPRAGMVDSTGTRRRLEALIATGWSMKSLGPAVGVHEDTVWRILNRPGKRVWASVAWQVADYYDRTWMRPAPPSRHRSFALRMAAARGYASPLAWDDEEIDDPLARPHGRQYREAG